MIIVYTLQLFWFLMFCLLVVITFMLTVCWNLCVSERTERQQCIDFQQFGESNFGISPTCESMSSFSFLNECLYVHLLLDFMFPKGVLIEDMKICQPNSIKLFCKDYVEKAEPMFVLGTSASVLIILSLVGKITFILLLSTEKLAVYSKVFL